MVGAERRSKDHHAQHTHKCNTALPDNYDQDQLIAALLERWAALRQPGADRSVSKERFSRRASPGAADGAVC